MTTTLIQRIISRRSYLAKTVSRMSSNCVSEDINTVKNRPHIPVMVEEVIENLNLKEGDMFLDMTFGAGGHTEALLLRIPKLKVFALDRDPTAVDIAVELGKKFPGQVNTLQGKFSQLPDLLQEYNVKQNSFDGILFDLGCSSMQLETPERGFSVAKDGPLDMRMGGDSEKSLTAADVIAYAEEVDLMQIFKIYGGEKQAWSIAHAIVEARAKFKPLKTTEQLKDLIETVLEREIRTNKLGRIVSPATKAFQALRIFVNNEINELHQGIILAHKYLKPMGRAVVISFHSAEDTIVKRLFTNAAVDKVIKPIPLKYYSSSMYFSESEIEEFQPKYWNMLHKKVIVPSSEEVEMNPRSRSACLRVAEKISNVENTSSMESFG